MNADGVVEVKMDQQGRVLIPTEIREKMRLEPGSRVSMFVDDDGLHLASSCVARQRLQRRVAETVPENTSLGDEMIADRRAEAARGVQK